MSFFEQTITFEIKVDGDDKKKVPTGMKKNVKLYDSKFDGRKKEVDDFIWEVVAEKGKEEKDPKADIVLPAWDLVQELQLTPVDNVSFKMAKAALEQLKDYMIDLLTVTKSAKLESWPVAFDKFVETYFKDKATFKQKKWDIYYGNGFDVHVPVLAFTPADNEPPVFWFFKDSLIKE